MEAGAVGEGRGELHGVVAEQEMRRDFPRAQISSNKIRLYSDPLHLVQLLLIDSILQCFSDSSQDLLSIISCMSQEVQLASLPEEMISVPWPHHLLHVNQGCQNSKRTSKLQCQRLASSIFRMSLKL